MIQVQFFSLIQFALDIKLECNIINSRIREEFFEV